MSAPVSRAERAGSCPCRPRVQPWSGMLDTKMNSQVVARVVELVRCPTSPTSRRGRGRARRT